MFAALRVRQSALKHVQVLIISIESAWDHSIDEIFQS